METSAKTSAAPAQPKDKPCPPFIFEWYENRIQRDLQMLYREDHAQRQKIVEIMEELTDSNMFWKLLACYSDVAESDIGEDQKHDALMALLARIYIAGSHRGAVVLD